MSAIINGGGGGTPGGINTQFQFNNAGAFAGSPNLVTTAAGIAVVGVNGNSPTMSIAGPVSGQTVALAVSTTAGDAQPVITAVSGNLGGTPGIQASAYGTSTNCSSAASPAACGSAVAGSVVVLAAATSVVVNTSQVTANSQILITRDDSLGTKLSVTCNTATVMGEAKVSARVAGTSFTITVQTAPATNPGCFSYSIIN